MAHYCLYGFQIMYIAELSLSNVLPMLDPVIISSRVLYGFRILHIVPQIIVRPPGFLRRVHPVFLSITHHLLLITSSCFYLPHQYVILTAKILSGRSRKSLLKSLPNRNSPWFSMSTF